MTKAELESKPLAELHALAAEQGVERYRMLTKAELVDRLADGEGAGAGGAPRPRSESRGDSGRRRQRERKPRQRERGERGERGGQRRERRPEKPAPGPEPPAEPEVAATRSERPRRKRRRRRWGRRRKDVSVRDLLLPATGARTIVYAESREACTGLLREVAADLSGASSGPDPIALLVDPTPVELAEWKRDAPQVEIVSAGQARHTGDAIAQAARRAEAGEDVIVLIDSLSRFAEAFKAANEAKDLFDAAQDIGGSGTLTVVAAVERPG
ncbi:MAG TPA: Rho termination factor N-terminal domain-containing protein [Solirubrobacterales bacterium]